MINTDTLLQEMLRRLRQGFLGYDKTDDVFGATQRMLKDCGGTGGLAQRLGEGSSEDRQSVEACVGGFLVGVSPDTNTYGQIARGTAQIPYSS